MRVYVPLTIAGLGRLLDGTGLPPGQVAYAVTDELAQWWAQGWADGASAGTPGAAVEELEYAAMLQAAAASLDLLDPVAVADGAEPARRVVLVADVDAIGTHIDDVPGATQLVAELAFAEVVAVHVDTADADGSVRAGVAALADDGAPASHVELVLADLVDHDLAWYAADEAAGLLDDLSECRP